MFVALDGDYIGRKIERLILSEKLDELTMFHKKVSNYINKIECLILKHNGQIFLSGGDNILAYCNDYIHIINFIKNINELNDDVTFSVGFAKEARLAYLALKYAKRSEIGKLIEIHIKNNDLMINNFS